MYGIGFIEIDWYIRSFFTASFRVTCIARDGGYLSTSIFRHVNISIELT